MVVINVVGMDEDRDTDGLLFNTSLQGLMLAKFESVKDYISGIENFASSPT